MVKIHKKSCKETVTISRSGSVPYIRHISLLLILFIVPPFMHAGAAGTPSGANLQILAVEIYPQPARPGEDMFIKINIENYGRSPAEDVVVELEEIFPFHFKYANVEHAYLHTANTTIRIPKISAYSHYEPLYYFTVDPQARSGEYELSFRISRTKEGTFGLVKNFRIDVEGTPDLVLINSSLSPARIEPGGIFTLKTNVASVGTGNAKNIRISLLLDDTSDIIMLDDNSAFIPRLNAGDSHSLEFRLQLSRDARITSYNIPIRITGVDETEKLYVNTTEMIGFDALARAHLNLASIKTEPVIGTSGEELKLTVRIENVGEGTATSVRASLHNLSFSGIKDAFIGKIEPDDDNPAVFTLIPDRSGTFDYTLRIDYEDDFGKHTVEEDLELMIRPRSIRAVIILLLLLAACAVIFLVVRKRSKGEHSE